MSLYWRKIDMNWLTTAGYIDAGSGSFLLTAIASGSAGTWFYIRSKWSAVRGRRPEEDAKADPSGVE